MKRYFALVLFGACLLGGCGGGGGTSYTPPPAGPATHFSVMAQATATAGIAFSFTVAALDASNNQVPTYSGTVHFSSSDAQAVLPGDQSLASGTATLQITLKTAGNQTITATDTVTKSITGTSAAISSTSGTFAVVVTPSTGSVQPGKTLQVTATVTNDPANAGVTWSVSCSTALPGAYVNATCGTVSSTATPSGTPTTYTAPSFGD